MVCSMLIELSSVFLEVDLGPLSTGGGGGGFLAGWGCSSGSRKGGSWHGGVGDLWEGGMRWDVGSVLMILSSFLFKA